MELGPVLINGRVLFLTDGGPFLKHARVGTETNFINSWVVL